MEPSDHDIADFTDPEAIEMGRILARGAALGIPLVFVISLGLIVAAGARGAGVLFVAAWAALIGGTFIGAGVLLVKRLSGLGTPEHSARTPARARTEGASSGASPAGEGHPHAAGS